MGKVLFGLLIAVIVWLLFFFKRKQKLGTSKPSVADRAASVESIVKCTRCGVNIPESEAIREPSVDASDTNHWRCRDGSSCSNSPSAV